MFEDVFRDGVAEVTLEANNCSKISFCDRLRTGEHLLWYRVKNGLSSKLSKKQVDGGSANVLPGTIFRELIGG